MSTSTLHSVQIRGLKNNPSLALRRAKNGIVVVMNREHPSAMIVNFDEKMLNTPSIQIAFATALFRDGSLSLVRAAKLANMPLVDFMQHLSRLGISIVQMSPEDLKKDIQTFESWLKSS